MKERLQQVDRQPIAHGDGVSVPPFAKSLLRVRPRDVTLIMSAGLAVAVHAMGLGAIIYLGLSFTRPRFDVQNRSSPRHSEGALFQEGFHDAPMPLQRIVVQKELNLRVDAASVPEDPWPSALADRTITPPAALPENDPPSIKNLEQAPPTPRFWSQALFTTAAPTNGGGWIGPAPRAGNPAPVYPVEALRRHWEGTCVLRVTIGTEGTPRAVAVATSSGYEILDQSAADAIGRWHFTPALDNGAVTECAIDLPVRFVRRRE